MGSGNFTKTIANNYLSRYIHQQINGERIEITLAELLLSSTALNNKTLRQDYSLLNPDYHLYESYCLHSTSDYIPWYDTRG